MTSNKASMRRVIFSATAAVVVILAMATDRLLAAKPTNPGGGGNTLYPVAAEFRCPVSGECFAADQIQGDFLGPYRGTTPAGSATTQEGLASNMGGYFTEGNLFLFSLKAGLGRFISFAFTHPIGTALCVASNTCRKTFSSANTDVSLPGSRTYPVDAVGTDLPNGFMSIPVGQSARARLYLNFADPAGRAILWTVRFDPAMYPGSTHLTVTRTEINRWIIEAIESDIAELVSANTSGKTVKVNEGYYTMPFRITVTK